MSKERATELEWLQWFYQNADFGPADDDVHRIMEDRFKEKTNKLMSKGYGDFECIECLKPSNHCEDILCKDCEKLNYFEFKRIR